MEGWQWIIFTVVFLTFLKETLKKWSAHSPKVFKWPAGPRKLPIIGNLHHLRKGGELAHVSLAKLANKHGPMMTIWFGSSKPTIVVSNLELAWEVLVSKGVDISSRKRGYVSQTINAGWKTIATSDLGPHWYTLRNGLHTTTLTPRNLFQQIPMQEEDISNLLVTFRKEAASKNGVVKPLPHIRRNTIKLISRFCFGSQYKDDQNFVSCIDKAMEEVMGLSSGGYLDVFEILRYVPGLNRRYILLEKVKSDIVKLFLPYISSYKPSDPPSPNCFLHFLLSQNFSEEITIFNMFELFLLAVDSVSSTTAWAIAFLIHNPQVQQKLYEEVNREFGRGAVRVERVKSLKYLHAVVKETMRMKPIAPLGIPHKADMDSSLLGTKILAGISVLVNLYAVMHDPKIWTEPHRFNPDRFLDASDEMEKSFMPFGAGRRMCAGKDLAELQVAFTLASLVSEFCWG